jgi:hypothetical protein
MSAGGDALDELFWRAEILQAMFWMRGEGLAEHVAPGALADFLGADARILADQMRRLAEQGYLEPAAEPPSRDSSGTSDAVRDPLSGGRPSAVGGRLYALTALGINEGGRSFRDEFEGLTKPAHGECAPGCTCRDPKHAGEPCPNRPEVARGA